MWRWLVVMMGVNAAAQPEISSWFTENAGRYARLYEDNAALAAGSAVTTWSRGQGTQSQPTYVGIHEISYSADWVYLRTTGLAGYPMGPWYLNAGDTQNFPNYPSNTATLFRIPRDPGTPPTTKPLTGLGAIGYFVDGVAMFDSRDAFSYSTGNNSDATPVNGITGDGVWNRDAYVNEGITFDAGNAHQAGNRYHYHANPPGLRYQLGDHVTYDPGTKTYTEKAGLPTEHSPIIGWMYDGYPIYGPYGFSTSTDPDSGIRRMISGFQKRTITQRHSLPAYAARNQGLSAAGNTNEVALAANRFGPDVSGAYVLGHYLEDYEYLGDLGQTQGVEFDLDEHNGRPCVTPEFPGGTYAYFTSIETNGTPRFPYNIGRTFFGTPTGDEVNTINEAVTLHFEGGPEKPATIVANPAPSGGVQTLLWSPVEGGTYSLFASNDLTDTNAWVLMDSDITPSSQRATNLVAVADADRQYFRFQQQAVATFDDNGFQYDNGGGGGTPTDPGVHPASGTRGTTLVITFIFDPGITPPLPPANVQPNSVTIGGVALTGVNRVDNVTITGTLTIPGGAAAGPQTTTVTFNGPPPYNFPNSFTFE